MIQYIDKSAVVAEIDNWRDGIKKGIFSIPLTSSDRAYATFEYEILGKIKDFLDTLEVKDPYEGCIQYSSIETGIKAYAETYSFNIESKLFHQLTKEQQALWRKEIEQAVISGGDAGVELAKDTRYKENLEVKEVDLDEEFDKCCENYIFDDECEVYTARHFFELGFKAKKE